MACLTWLFKFVMITMDLIPIINGVIQSSNTLGVQTMFQNAYMAGCNITATSPLIAALRPNTKFNVCETGSFNYSWTSGATLDNPSAQDPFSSGIYTNTDFTITVVSPSNPNCAATDVVSVLVDNSNSIDATVAPTILCEPGLVTLTGTPAGTPPKYQCGDENVACAAPFNSYFLNGSST